MTQNIRIFTALPLSDLIRKLIFSHIPAWQATLSFERWVHSLDWHITLHFIGDVHPSALSDIELAMRKAVSELSSFSLSLTDLGVFGRGERPSVLWLGLDGDMKSLHLLHDALGTALMASTGFTPESRPFKPHMTLARKYAGLETCSTELLSQSSSLIQQHSTAFTIDRIVLYRTHLGHSPMYEEIFSCPLPLNPPPHN
ncbi:MAG: RNA 2',3'-cyclic phosphodiesterase [Candidatus Pristimantibacillus sp.]